MKDIHRTHVIGPSAEIDGKFYEHCLECGAVADHLLEKPCPGRSPSLAVIQDDEVIAIQWAFPEGGVKSSAFPQPLITVDAALDGRPIQVVFAGARARELREALCDPLAEQEKDEKDINDLKKICGGSVERPAFYKDDFHFNPIGAAAARILARRNIIARVGVNNGQVTFSSPRLP